MAHQFGFDNVVAALGTSFTTGHGRILRRYAKKIVLIFDSDTAGTEAANRALQVCLSQHIDIKIASIPGQKDPCDFLLSAPKEQFEKLIADATDVFEFKWQRLKESFDTDNTLSDRKQAIEEFLLAIAAAANTGNLSAIDKGLIINRLSSIIGLDTKQINAELNRKIRTVNRTNAYNKKDQYVKKIDSDHRLSVSASREILEVLLNEPNLFQSVRNKIDVEFFEEPQLKEIAAIMLEMLNENNDISINQILAKTESVDTAKTIVQLAQNGAEKENYISRLNGALNTITKYNQNQNNRMIKTLDQKKQADYQKENPYSVGMV